MEHTPVLLSECIDGLKIVPGGIYVDGTLGRGGHALEIAKRLHSGKLVAIDRDADSINEAGARLLEYKDQITLVHGNFADIPEILDKNGIKLVDGMVFDLGASSPQLDDSSRGFSYMHDAPLDMRMDRRENLTARDAINTWTEEKLRKVFYEFGEERYAGPIARAITRKRSTAPIDTTFQLNNVILSAIPAAARREAQHPSKRCYQALRIAINDELGNISQMLKTVPDRLKTGGRICVISFHSLEDRIIKNSLASREKGCVCPKDFPICVCGFVPTLKLITKKPIVPKKTETELNPRARSAKLRIAQRV
ncbi:MAG: 16S rRNA (cytosine(1402)-N(4))-methyltransferase RsmH [Oscillospiraceae bacterium]|nr:16S rRNA (cytosine(1402)-N(4))-methyltransferase RsmH [Oscillospiraceae bacterium]